MGEFYWVKESKKLWNERAQIWHAKSKDMWENGSRKEIVPFFRQYVQEGGNICDLGCGDGYGAFKLAESGYFVTGIDVSDEMLEKARSLEKAPVLQFQKGDIASIEVPDNTYDAMMAINSLEWTESPLDVLQEMKRVVKPRGKVCVGILGPTAGPRVNSFRRLYGDKVVCNTMMPWEFERLATENGWNKLSELGVFKRDSEKIHKESLSNDLIQALTFMSIFMLENNKLEG